jgi:2-haloacid dehalogenase
MAITRRGFVRLAAGGVTANLAARLPVRLAEAAASSSRLKAVAFDAFPVFNPAPVASRAEAVYPGQGALLAEEWRLRQFEYAWLRSLSERYVDFWKVTEDALVFAARKLRLELDAARGDALMGAFLELVPWTDVVPALTSLRKGGLLLGFLSNFTSRMLEANLERAGLRDLFDHVVSTDRARTYKPDPNAYRLGTEAFALRRDEILFAAHAGWDAAGAKAFGYPTFWVNRAGVPPEELGAPPDATGHDLFELVRFVRPLGGDGGR